MADKLITAHPLSAACLAFGGRCATAGGALCALLSLYFDAPVWVASLRGAAVWLVLRWLVSATARSAVASLAAEPQPAPPSAKPAPTAPTTPLR